MTWNQVRHQLTLGGRRSIATALGLSLLIHLLLYGGWMWGNALGLWDLQASWLQNIGKKKEPARTPRDETIELTAPLPKEIPLTFVEVDPVTATPEPPEDSIFYGAQNSKAANPEPSDQSPAPKADGTQKQVPRVADVPRNQPPPTSEPPPTPIVAPTPAPLEPAPLQPNPTPSQTAQKDSSSPTEPSPGDLTKVERFLTPTDVKPDTEEKAVLRTPARPRTLEEARRRLGLAGRKLQQEGGVKRPGLLSFDVKATEFGSYDAAFIAAVQKRWYDLIDIHNSQTVPRSGKVVVEFRLTYEGRITEMRVGQNEVGEIFGLLCQRAIMDPAPYAAWPKDMRQRMGNFRDVTFTFFYN